MTNSPIHIDLGNVGKLSEPLSKLIDVIAKGTGIAALGTVLQAKTDATAKMITTKSDLAAASLVERAQARSAYREALRQQNIERIAFEAAKELPASVSPQPLEQDWILQFFDNAQDVCDADMQTLWGRVLAGEVGKPGSYTKRTLQFLKTIEFSKPLKNLTQSNSPNFALSRSKTKTAGGISQKRAIR